MNIQTEAKNLDSFQKAYEANDDIPKQEVREVAEELPAIPAATSPVDSATSPASLVQLAIEKGAGVLSH